MAKKRQKPDEEHIQLSLFDIQVNLNSERSDNADDADDDWLQDEELGSNFETSDRTIEPQTRDLLTLKLLREAIQSQNPGDHSFRV